MSVLLGLGPGLGSHVHYLPFGQCRQAREGFSQVGLRVDAAAAAGLYPLYRLP